MYRWIRSEMDAKSCACVTARTIAVFPLDGVKWVGNFAQIVLLSFCSLPDFVLWKSVKNFVSFLKFASRCVTYATSYHGLSSTITLDQWTREKSLSNGINDTDQHLCFHYGINFRGNFFCINLSFSGSGWEGEMGGLYYSISFDHYTKIRK